MPTHFADTSARDAIDAAHALDGFGVELPPEATRWLNKLNELRANPPAETPRNRVAELIADSAKPAEVDRALAYSVSQNLRAGQHRLAQQIVGARMLDEVMRDRDRLHRELKVTADDLIGRLHEAATITETVIELTRERRTDEAHLVATIESDVGELRALYDLRDNYLTPAHARWDAGQWSCRYFANPWHVRHPAPGGSGQWDHWKAYIKAGAELWYPSFEEAAEAVNAHQLTPAPYASELVTPTAKLSGQVFAG